MDYLEDKDFRMSLEEEITCAEGAPLYNKLPENEMQYTSFTDGSCCIIGKHQMEEHHAQYINCWELGGRG